MRASDETFACAGRLRHEMTLPEVLLWCELRRRTVAGLRFRRQHPIGRCVLDFYLPSSRLAVEVDGRSHDLGENPERDARRDAWLASRGVRVLRVPAPDILDPDRREGVLRWIAEQAHLGPPPSASRTPPP